MLALDEINAAGGLLGKKVRVLTEDDQSKPEEVVTAVLKLIKQDQVIAVIGEVASSRTLAAAPICQANQRSDAVAGVDQSQGHAGRRLHLPRLLHRSIPGLDDGASSRSTR